MCVFCPHQSGVVLSGVATVAVESYYCDDKCRSSSLYWQAIVLSLKCIWFNEQEDKRKLLILVQLVNEIDCFRRLIKIGKDLCVHIV